MQAAASKGRSNVADAFEKRGHLCTPSMREEAASIAADE